MVTARGGARLGIVAACVIFVASLVVLATGAADARRAVDSSAGAGHSLVGPGTVAPDFLLTDSRTEGPLRLSELRGSIVVLQFTSIRCPTSNACGPRLAALARSYVSRTLPSGPTVRFLGIHCDLGTGPVADRDRREIPVQTRAAGLDFPQLLDNDGAVARRYGVDRTPAFVVIDTTGVVRYRGSLEGAPGTAATKSPHLQAAIDALLQGATVAQPETEIFGCDVKSGA